MSDEVNIAKSPEPSRHASNDIVAAVVDIVSHSGPDAVHLSVVAQAVGRSLAEMEETFGHPGELLYLAWHEVLRSAFEDLVISARAIMSGQFESLAGDETASPLRRAAVHLLVVAHRFDELREEVPFDVQRILYSQEADHANVADRSVLRAIVGWMCGAVLDPTRHSTSSLELLPDIGWHDGCWSKQEPQTSYIQTPALALTFDGVGDFNQDILLACTRIVAQGGVGRATLLRIARAAGYPPAVVYDMFGRQEYLLAQYVGVVFSTLFAYRRMLDILTDPALAEMRLEVWLEPELRNRRRALVECVLASAFSPVIASAYDDALEEGLVDLRIGTLGSDESQTANMYRRFVATRHITLGLAVLSDVEIDTWSRDWGPFLRAFLSDTN